MHEVPSDGDNKLTTVETSFSIIESLYERDGAGVTQLADHLGLAKSTVHYHLLTLRNIGFVVKEDGQFYLSLQFFRLGDYSRTRKDVYKLATEEVEYVAEQCKEQTQFVAREGWMGIPLATAGPKHYIGYTIGEPLHLHATAAGKAILAYFEQDAINTLLGMEIPQVTPDTITDPDTIRNELEKVRNRGYAVNRGESHEGLHAVAVPILRSNGNVIGSLSISGPKQRLQGERIEEELPNLLKGVADELKLNLAYS